MLELLEKHARSLKTRLGRLFHGGFRATLTQGFSPGLFFVAASRQRPSPFQESAMLGRLKPIFSIRANKVVGLTPKSSAAPPIPLILQPVF